MDNDEAEARILETGRLPSMDWSEINSRIEAGEDPDPMVEALNEAVLQMESIGRQVTSQRRLLDGLPRNVIETGMADSIETDLRKLTLALYRRCVAVGARPRDKAREGELNNG